VLQEIALLKKTLAEKQAEADRLNAQQSGKDKTPKGGGSASQPAGDAKAKQDGAEAKDDEPSEETKTDAEVQKQREELDARSVYVGNVDYSTTPEELHTVFQSCGTVNRVTVLTDRNGAPKGYAYVEFLEPDAVEAAVALTETEIHGRPIRVNPKRTNNPGMKRGRGRGRGRGFYDYYGWYGGYPPPMPYFPGPMRGRGRRGRWYSPY